MVSFLAFAAVVWAVAIIEVMAAALTRARLFHITIDLRLSVAALFVIVAHVVISFVETLPRPIQSGFFMKTRY
jgi:hypothetical protein